MRCCDVISFSDVFRESKVVNYVSITSPSQMSLAYEEQMVKVERSNTRKGSSNFVTIWEPVWSMLYKGKYSEMSYNEFGLVRSCFAEH